LARSISIVMTEGAVVRSASPLRDAGTMILTSEVQPTTDPEVQCPNRSRMEIRRQSA